MKTVLCLLIIYLSIITNFTSAQSRPGYGKYFIVGSSITYIPNYENIDYDISGRLDEITWNVNMGISITKRLVSGLQLLNIYNINPDKSHHHYTIYGFFNQFNIAASSNSGHFWKDR
jgi:hypothetical protein